MAYEAPHAISQGIVLYSGMPLKRKVTLLDAQKGKITCIVRNVKRALSLSHGARVEYMAEQNQDRFIASWIEPISTPAEWVSEDIYFLHHVLELCMAYIPDHHAAHEAFMLLSILYEPWKSSMTQSFFKKLFLCKLHISLGLYPAEEVHDPLLLSLISCAGDSMFDFQSDTELEGKLAVWLYRSLHTANAQVCLKTFSFVKRLDIHYEDT